MPRFKRLRLTRNWLVQLIATSGTTLAVLEGYGYANKFTLGTMIEIGTTLRLTLMEAGIKFVEVAPKSLKKFVTGTGDAKKADMIKRVAQQWGLDTDDHDAVDAYGLAQFGRCLLGADVGLPAAHTAKVKSYLDKII